MSQGKPDDIPQDVWDAARSTYEELFRIGAFRGAGVVVDPQATIARAIMAERERCAKVAFDRAHQLHREAKGYATAGDEDSETSCLTAAVEAMELAVALRNLPPPNGDVRG